MWDEFSLPTKSWQSDTLPRQLLVSYAHLSRFLVCSLKRWRLELENEFVTKLFAQRPGNERAALMLGEWWWWGAEHPSAMPSSPSLLVGLRAHGKGGGEEREEKGAEVTLFLHPSQAASAARCWGSQETSTTGRTCRGSGRRGQQRDLARAGSERERSAAPGNPWRGARGGGRAMAHGAARSSAPRWALPATGMQGNHPASPWIPQR